MSHPSHAGRSDVAHVEIDAEPERHDPGHAEQLQHPVAGEHLLGRPAVALLDEQEVAEHRRQHRHDRQLVERQIGAGQLLGLQRPQAIADDRRTARHRQHTAQICRRVRLQREAHLAGTLADLTQLRITLAGDDEQ